MEVKPNPFNIPPTMRTAKGTVKEGFICPTCNKFYSDHDNMESITKAVECLNCSHVRAEVEDQKKDIEN